MFAPDTRILVVDDALTVRKLIVMTIKKMGFTDILEAGDGALAWSAMKDAEPRVSLVLSDWNMPNCTGLDLLKRVRADATYETVPFIMLTAEAEKSQIIEAMKAGVSGYVVKPINPQILTDKLEEIYKKLMGVAA